MRYCIENTDGTVALITLTSNELAVQDQIDKWPGDYKRDIKAIHEINSAPGDLTFRDAWRWKDGVIIDMPAARMIWMSRIRAARKSKLAELDIPTMTALSREDSAAAAAIDAQKQVLRDIPATFDLSLASTPIELVGMWPQKLSTE